MKSNSEKSSLRESLGMRIKERRLSLGMTLADIAEKVSVSPQAASLWERGTASIGAERLIALADVLQCDSYWLMTGENKEIRIKSDLGLASEKNNSVDMEIVQKLNLLPMKVKTEILEEIDKKINYYNDLYMELKQSRE